MTIENNPAAAAMQDIENLMKIIADAQTTGTDMAKKLVKMTTMEKIGISDLEYMGTVIDTYA
jgi:hypothetical protein